MDSSAFERLVVSDPHFPLGLPIAQAAMTDLGLASLSVSRGRLSAFQMLAARATEVWVSEGETAWRASELLLASVLHDLLRAIATYYDAVQVPGCMARAAAEVDSAAEAVEGFRWAFPPALPDLDDADGCRELLLLSLANGNPAFGRYRAILDDRPLQRETSYLDTLLGLNAYFDALPRVAATGQSLLDTLRAPILASPDSLEGQVSFILDTLSELLPEGLRTLALRARDAYREETAPRFGGGPGPMHALTFGEQGGATVEDFDFEAFTQDKDWMARVVVIAKSTYVWLDQLSTKYGRPIQRLDQIPDEELDRFGQWGFSGLWLIGLWQRSSASAEIKKRMGDGEALASAYSLYDYNIAHELGGDEAYRNLAGRAWARGVRLAADMVPNHVGIYSRWVVERPDYFLQTDVSPYPNYTFNGPDLSEDSRVSVRIEDGYWNHSDAAVTFQRVDHATGEVRYIYHGNDGTQMPWNDTAQLDYIKAEVREAVIGEILHVARMFPIIRFDAAMTLARRHIRRLWHPNPGEGGAIPSRSDHAVSMEEFNFQMPNEFWRDVVDRIQAEAPDTLLLAEAFWLMEGYFVRTLGMHRVYNSAFMHMLKMEENGKYRDTVRNVLEYSPPILQRFVNFMNNPDEETAVVQFGKGDKYIGVATMMVTMPGLPMFGHGQVEGFSEKYGMEFHRARWAEEVDEDLVERHEREVFPLMRKRWLFSGAEEFAFFDFVTEHNGTDENVFAYTNRVGAERALVFYNNAYNSTAGRIHTSVPMNFGTANEPQLHRRSLAAALDLQPDRLYVFQEHISGLWFVRPGHELIHSGFWTALRGYQTRVFWRFRDLAHADHHWWALVDKVGWEGVADIDRAWEDERHTPYVEALRHLARATVGTPSTFDAREAMVALETFLAGTPLDNAERLRETLDVLIPASTDVAEADAEAEADADATEAALLDAVHAVRPEVLRAVGLTLGLSGDVLPLRYVQQVLGEHLGEDLAAALVILSARPATFAAALEASDTLLRVNLWEGTRWFAHEPMQSLLEAWTAWQVVDGLLTTADASALTASLAQLRAAVEAAVYRYDDLVEALEGAVSVDEVEG